MLQFLFNPRSLAPLAFGLFALALPEVASAQVTVTLPDIVVTSTGSSGPDKFGAFWSGVRTTTDILGSATGGTLPAGTYAAGTSITFTIRPTTGYAFQLKANDRFDYYVSFSDAAGGSRTINLSTTTAVFLGVQGGTIDGDNQFTQPAIGIGYENTNYYEVYDASSLFGNSGLSVTGTPTYLGIQFTTVLSSALTFSELNFASLTLVAHSTQTDAFSLVPTGSAVPEPSTYAAIFGALALGAVAAIRQRRRAAVVQN